MSENLFPENFSTDLQAVLPENTNDLFIGYKQSAYFDFKTGDFKRDGANNIIKSTGTDAWIQWVIKCLNTPRYDCLAYSTDFGINMQNIFNSTTKKEIESNITREIREALYADPYERLSYIESISFEWLNDCEVNITCVLEGINGDTAVVKTTISQK